MPILNDDRTKVESGTSGGKEKFVSFLSILPPQLRRKIIALKKISFQTSIMEAKFIKNTHKLEITYHKRFSKLYKKREKIVSGLLEPTDSDCDFDDGTESPDENDKQLKKQRKMWLPVSMNSKTKGIPGFWLTVLKSVEMIRVMITPRDEPILLHLSDISMDLKKPMIFSISFRFSANPYFTNPVLTKCYELENLVGTSQYQKMECSKLKASKGSNILWKEGMDVTRRSVVRRKGERIITGERTVRCESFFNFFLTMPMPEESHPLYEKAVCVRDLDYMVGLFFKENLIPHAVLYYTGEAAPFPYQDSKLLNSKVRMSTNVNWLQLANK